MKPDLRSTFQRGAPSPRSEVDVPALLEEGRRRGRTRYLVFSAATLAVIVVGAVAVSALVRIDRTDRPVAPDLGTATDVIGEMRRRQEGAASVRPFDSLTELLDNTLFQMGDASPKPLTEAVIVGQVIDVQPGRAFTDETDDAPDGTETDFGDPDAIWRSIHVSINVETVVSGAVDEPVLVGFAFDPRLSVEDIRAQFEEFGSVLLFLNRSPVFDYDPHVYGTVLDGALLGLVDARGQIQLPVLEANEGARLLQRASTIEQLRAAAKEPRRVIQLDESGARSSD